MSHPHPRDLTVPVWENYGASVAAPTSVDVCCCDLDAWLKTSLPHPSFYVVDTVCACFARVASRVIDERVDEPCWPLSVTDGDGFYHHLLPHSFVVIFKLAAYGNKSRKPWLDRHSTMLRTTADDRRT